MNVNFVERNPLSLAIAQLILTLVSRTISSLFTNFCCFPFQNLEAKIILTNFACSSELLSLCDSECFCEIRIILKINAVATPAAFKITELSLIPFVNAL